MKLHRLLTTLAFLFTFSFGFAQITVKGELRLGDTTQVHILKTKDGSILTGRVIGFDQDQLTFLFKNQNSLIFKISEIESVEVQTEKPAQTPEKPAAPLVENEVLSPTPFMYAVVASDGKTHSGKLTVATAQGFRLLDDDGKTRYFYWREADTLRYIGPALGTSVEERHVLHTTRGDRFTGQVFDYDGSTLRFKLDNGAMLKFSTRDLRKIELTGETEVAGAGGNQGEIEMQGHERLYFSPSAFLLEKGQGEFRTVILNNSIDYGLSDNFTIGGGMATVIIASVLNAKVKFGGSLNDYLHVAAGAQVYGAFAIESDPIGAALAYGALTVGTEEKFLSVAVGRGTSGESDGATTGFSFTGSFRVAQQFRLYGEFLSFNDSFGDNIGFGIAGGSWFNNHHRVDFGFVVGNIFDLDSGTVLPFPLVSYAYRF